MDVLPHEILQDILNLLSPYDWCNSRLVNWTWYHSTTAVQQLRNEQFTKRLRNGTLAWKKWGAVGDVPAPRTGMSCVVCGNSMYMFGGFVNSTRNVRKKCTQSYPFIDNDDPSGDARGMYVFDLCTHTWKRVESHGEQPQHRKYFTLVAHHHHIVLHGGFTDDDEFLDDTHVFDIQSQQWNRVVCSTYPSARAFQSASFVGDEMVCIYILFSLLV